MASVKNSTSLHHDEPGGEHQDRFHTKRKSEQIMKKEAPSRDDLKDNGQIDDTQQ